MIVCGIILNLTYLHIRESQNIASLHNQITACDEILEVSFRNLCSHFSVLFVKHFIAFVFLNFLFLLILFTNKLIKLLAVNKLC